MDYNNISLERSKIKQNYQNWPHKNYSCDSCSKGFKSIRSLNKHKRTVCDGISKLSEKQCCDHCQKSVKNLSYHKATVHRLPSQHCDRCNFSTKYVANLKAHKNRVCY